jgi:outer membrane protease
MKKTWFIIMSIAMAMELSAQDYQHAFSLDTSVGLLHGQAEEIVFRDGNSDDKLSQLLWNFKPLVYAGVDIRYNWQNPANKWGIFADALFKFGFPGETGVMEDRDWLVDRYTDFLTHYSVHDNKTESAILIDINAGVSFKIFKFLLKPFLAYNYMNFSWTASGGSFLYPSSDGDHYYSLTDRDVGTYEQAWNIISIGVSFHGAFNRYFDTDISLKLSPFIWCTVKDNHILRSLIITGNLAGGFFVEPSLLFSFTPNNFFKLSLSAAYRYISGSRGDLEYREQGKTLDVPTNIGGVGYSALDIGIIANFKIFEF